MKRAKKPFDLIVMDWLMPGITGTEAAEKVMTEIKPKKVPHIIMVSAYSAGDMSDKPGAQYVDKFLTKPVSPSHLFDEIMHAFGHAEVQTSRRKMSTGRGFDQELLKPVQGAEILLVEDNEINQQVAQEILEQAKFRVEIANHGQEAIDRLALKRYDCVLMDVQMPVMDGFTATSLLREDPQFEDLPILAMTANATVEDRKRCLEAGMNEHIPKPINPGVLFEALLKWIPHGNATSLALIRNERVVTTRCRRSRASIPVPVSTGWVVTSAPTASSCSSLRKTRVPRSTRSGRPWRRARAMWQSGRRIR